jgi:hypothetical protein
MTQAQAYKLGLQPYVQENQTATSLVAITPADTDLTTPVRGLYVAGGGDIKLTSADGTTVTITVPSYTNISCVITRVWSTGTTATGITGYN